MRPAYAADKLVLWALADAANDKTLLAFPSNAAVVEFTGLERKRVMTSLARLASMKLIEDTGERIGKTKQVRVWRVMMTDETVPWADPLAAIIRA